MFARRKKISRRGQRRLVSRTASEWLNLPRAAVNNLKKITVKFPLGTFCGCDRREWFRQKHVDPQNVCCPKFNPSLAKSSGKSNQLSGHESPQGRLRGRSIAHRSHAALDSATYVGFFDDIRVLFSQVPEARMRGYSASRFSFNSVQGRCPECEGAGQIKLK